MKKKIFLTLATLTVFLPAEIVEKIQVENAIKDQIKESLSLVLDNDQYLVFVGSAIKNDRVKEVDSLEEERYTRESSPPQSVNLPRRNVPSYDDVLPGFPEELDEEPQNSVVYNYNNPFSEEKEYKKEKYSYIDDIKLRNVRITVILDKNIPQEKTRQLISSLREKVRSSYGPNSSISFKSAPIVKEKKNKSITERLSENPVLALLLGLILFLIFLTLLLFGVLFLYFFFSALRRIFGGRNKKEQNNKRNLPPAQKRRPVPPPNANVAKPAAEKSTSDIPPVASIPKEDDILAKKLFQERIFVNKFTDRPLISRKFFLELPKDEKEVLYQAFDSSTVHNLFEKLDPSMRKLKGKKKADDDDNDEVSDNDRLNSEIIDKYTKDLDYFKKLNENKMNDDFGVLSLLTKQELKAVFREMPPESLAALLKNVDKNIADFYISELNDEKRKDLLAQLNTEISNLPGEKLVDLKDRIKRATGYIERNVFVENPDKDELSRTIIETSDNAKSMVTNIQQSDEELYEKLKHFTYDETDLMQEEEDYIRRLLENIETEDIAKASFIVDDNFKNKMMGVLSEERQDFVQSIIDVNRNSINREEAKAGLKKILTSYRERKANEM